MYAFPSTAQCNGAPTADGLMPDDPEDDEPLEPDELAPATIDPSDEESLDTPSMDDDPNWDVFIPDDDECDPLPEPGDFWIDTSQQSTVENPEQE
jgi:hypothetical protein